MRWSLTLLCALITCGCDGTGGESFDDARDRMWAEVDAEAEKERQEKIANAQPLETYGWPASSPEELVEAYKNAFAAGDIVAIEAMTKFDNVSDEKTESMLNQWLKTRPSGEATITDGELRPPSEREQSVGPREVVAVFEGNYRYNDDSGGGNTTGMIIEEDGQYWFYVALPQEAEQAEPTEQVDAADEPEGE